MAPEDLTVKIGGQEYKIPADLDLATTAKLIGLGKKLAEDPAPETVKEFEGFITELLSVRQKPPVAIRMTMSQALALVKAVTGTAQEMADKTAPFAG
jgi:hypothetical protein